MKRIPLTQGKTALVSDADYATVAPFEWYASRENRVWYAKTNVQHGQSRTTIRMHRLLAGFPPFRLDHRNRNGLDNRRVNLRPASHSQNLANGAMHSDNRAGRKGVSWFVGGCWRARLRFQGKDVHCSYHKTVAKAARAYANAARKYFGKFARIS